MLIGSGVLAVRVSVRVFGMAVVSVLVGVFDIGVAFGSGYRWGKRVVFTSDKDAGVRVVWVLASWRAAATVPSVCPGHGG